MNGNRILAAAVFTLLISAFNFSESPAQGPDGCVLDTTSQAVAFGPRDTLRGVAIWASSSGNYAHRKKLPPFWRQVWNVNELVSVPKFYKDNSDSAGAPRFVLSVDVFGAPDSNCFIGGNFSGGLCGGNDPTVFKNILDSADAYIDFRNYDRNGDQFVDAVFFCINDSLDQGLRSICISGTYNTKDSIGGQPMKITGSHGAHAYAFNREEFVQTMCHEIGHYITPNPGGLGEYYARTSSSWWVTGAFTVMGKSGFQRRSSPFHPFQNHKFLGWDQPIDITSTTYNQQIEPYFSSVKKSYRIKRNSTEYFEVSYHINGPTGALWEQNWPATGLLIAHINEDVANPLDFGKKQIDLELPHPDGLRTYVGNPCFCFTTPNDSTGRDSLDAFEPYPIAMGIP